MKTQKPLSNMIWLIILLKRVFVRNIRGVLVFSLFYSFLLYLGSRTFCFFCDLLNIECLEISAYSDFTKNFVYFDDASLPKYLTSYFDVTEINIFEIYPQYSSTMLSLCFSFICLLLAILLIKRLHSENILSVETQLFWCYTPIIFIICFIISIFAFYIFDLPLFINKELTIAILDEALLVTLSYPILYIFSFILIDMLGKQHYSILPFNLKHVFTKYKNMTVLVILYYSMFFIFNYLPYILSSNQTITNESVLYIQWWGRYGNDVLGLLAISAIFSPYFIYYNNEKAHTAIKNSFVVIRKKPACFAIIYLLFKTIYLPVVMTKLYFSEITETRYDSLFLFVNNVGYYVWVLLLAIYLKEYLYSLGEIR